jgi:hypothetical protein
MTNGAMTLAEGSQHKDYKTDATLILNGTDARGHILRTAYDPLPVWKTKYAKGISPFYPRVKTTVREAALIDDEIWVFGIDGRRSQDIVDAVTIATSYYKVPAKYFLSSIYIKNLNVENEHSVDLQLRVQLNKELYEKTVIAIREACTHFGIRTSVNIHVYSSNINYKIPKDALHEALRSGGASHVETDSRELNYRSGSNDNKLRARVDTNMHVAKLDF